MIAHALVWIIVTIMVIIVMMSLLDTYIDLVKCTYKKEGYWPVPYFAGEYTQNDKERYFDYMPLPAIYRTLQASTIPI